MKVVQECYPCLQKLIQQAAELGSEEPEAREKAVEMARRELEVNFSLDKVSIVIAGKLHRAVKEATGNPDPYRVLKEREMAMAREIYAAVAPRYRDGFKGYLELAVLGNSIDFFRPLEEAKADMQKHVAFAIDDSAALQARLPQARSILYLADNAGECYFDLPLVQYLRQFARVVYAVKDEPVQNDLALEDLRRAGLEKELGPVITTGSATPGIDLAQASPAFKEEFERADLVVAKGMGYYESLSELPPRGRIFYCLMAKCPPVAASLGVPLHSYIAMLR